MSSSGLMRRGYWHESRFQYQQVPHSLGLIQLRHHKLPWGAQAGWMVQSERCWSESMRNHFYKMIKRLHVCTGDLATLALISTIAGEQENSWQVSILHTALSWQGSVLMPDWHYPLVLLLVKGWDLGNTTRCLSPQ